MKNLVLTIAVGDVYKTMSAYTHPSIKAYADKIGADFIVIDKSTCSTPHWEKFESIYNLLGHYDRIFYIDTDTLIRADCPNIFDIVPADELGIFNEMPWVSGRQYSLYEACKDYGITVPKWDGRYFNTGVMVIPRQFKQLFKKPYKEVFNFYEQGYFNASLFDMIQKTGNEFTVFELPYQYNRMTCMDVLGEERHASYILHYAGYPSLEFVIGIIKGDIDKWAKDNGKYNYQRHILINVQGGLGDQICAEPSIRFMKKRIYPNDDIIVVTHFPELFEHLNCKVYQHGQFTGNGDIPHCHLKSLPGPDTMNWSVVSNLMSHTVDYSSISLLKRTLPNDEKNMVLNVTESGKKEVSSVLNGIDAKGLILVHPGRHWESKTFPVKWWQNVIDGLAKYHTVCIIGQDEKTRGTVAVKAGDNVIDIRNLLSLKGLIALISEAKILVTNDSGPLHIAGAFENGIILIPTCKHSDHLLPFRHSNQNFRAKALFKKMMSFEFDARPTSIKETFAHFLPGTWDEFLPDEYRVVSESIELFDEIG